MTVGDLVNALKELPQDIPLSVNGICAIEGFTITIDRKYDKEHPNGISNCQIFFSEE